MNQKTSAASMNAVKATRSEEAATSNVLTFQLATNALVNRVTSSLEIRLAKVSLFCVKKYFDGKNERKRIFRQTNMNSIVKPFYINCRKHVIYKLFL